MLQEGGVKIWRPRQVRPCGVVSRGKRANVVSGLCWVGQSRLCSNRKTAGCSGIESGAVAGPPFRVSTLPLLIPFTLFIGLPVCSISKRTELAEFTGKSKL